MRQGWGSSEDSDPEKQKAGAERGHSVSELPERTPARDEGVSYEDLEELRTQLEAEVEELRRSQEEAEVYRDLYLDLYESSPVGYVTLNSHGHIEAANATSAALFGIPKGRLISRPLASFITSLHQSSFAVFWASILETGRAACELELLKPNGTAFYARLEGVAWTDPPTGKWAVRAAIGDLSDRKRVEQERDQLIVQLRAGNERVLLSNLRAQEQAEEAQRRAAELDCIIASVPDGIAIFNGAGEVVEMNPAAALMLAPLNAQRQPVTDESSDRDVVDGGWLLKALARRALNGEAVSNEVSAVKTPAGEIIWVSAGAVALLTAEGKLFGAVVRLTDITIVYELQQRQEMLLRTVSHDLRSPLTVIKGHSQHLQRVIGMAGPKGRGTASLQAITESADRMNAMIQELVDMARLERGQLRLEKRAIDLREFICSMVDRAYGALDLDRVSLQIPGDLPHVQADPDYLERILMNLLTNALKYSSPDTEVLIKAESNHDGVGVSFADHGIGIPTEQMPFLFESYFHGKQTRKSEGLGLGLYITRMLVQAHGGRIWAKSEPSKGSIFHFTVPLA